jgi:hypothetical protein
VAHAVVVEPLDEVLTNRRLRLHVVI